jgi:hypothetical protein
VHECGVVHRAHCCAAEEGGQAAQETVPQVPEPMQQAGTSADAVQSSHAEHIVGSSGGTAMATTSVDAVMGVYPSIKR